MIHRQLLLEGLKISEQTNSLQLKTISLSVLSSLFLLPDPVQSGKMIATAHGLAKKTRNEILLACCSKMKRDLARRSKSEGNDTIEEHSDAFQRHISSYQEAIAQVSLD